MKKIYVWLAYVSGLCSSSQMFLWSYRFLSLFLYSFSCQQGFHTVFLKPWTQLTIFSKVRHKGFRWLDREERPSCSRDKVLESFPLEGGPTLGQRHGCILHWWRLLSPDRAWRVLLTSSSCEPRKIAVQKAHALCCPSRKEFLTFTPGYSQPNAILHSCCLSISTSSVYSSNSFCPR